ncbi:MAG: tetratricopeptide repeat protein [Deltaproteobacteria bacterium]|nr:tetratricopeptide repeat protein [Deltaproteobacteria bacterium]
MKTILLLISFLTVGFSTETAWAETDSDAAKRHFREGTSHYDLGDFKQAVDSYKAGYRIKPDPVFLYNIGQAHRMLKEYDQAITAYKAYLRNRPQAPNRADVESKIENMRAERAAGVVKALPVDKPNTAPPPPSDPPPIVAVPSNPPADAPNQTMLTTSQPDAELSQHLGEQDSQHTMKRVPWMVAGAGGLLMAGGVVTGLLAKGKQSDLESECPTRQACSQRAEDLRDSGKTLALTTDILFVVGGAAVATGVIWWALKYRTPSSEASTDSPQSKPPLMVLSCVPGSCGAAATFAF